MAARKAEKNRESWTSIDPSEVWPQIDDANPFHRSRSQKLFPHSELSANLWIATPSLRYGGLIPLDTIFMGFEGMRWVGLSLIYPNNWR